MGIHDLFGTVRGKLKTHLVFFALLIATLTAIVALTRSPEFQFLIYYTSPTPKGVSETISDITNSSYQKFNTPSESSASDYGSYLLERTEGLSEELAAFEGDECRIVAAYAQAGYGKTSLVDVAVQAHIPDRVKSGSIDLADYLKDFEGSAPDLKINERTINELPTLSRELAEILIDSLLDLEGQVILLDSLDELHQSSAAVIFDQVRQKRNAFAEAGIDLLIFMRPEVINTEYKWDNDDDRMAGINVVRLPPQDIRRDVVHLRVANYLNYKAKKAIENGTENHSGVILGLNDEPTLRNVTSKLTDAIDKQPFLAETLRAAFLNALVIDHVRDPEASLGDNGDEIRRQISSRVAARNSGSHGRPVIGSTSAAVDDIANALYNKAIFKIASEVIPDEDGDFLIPEQLSFSWREGDSIAFDPYFVLQRSGFVSFVPSKGSAKARFEPIWLQTELALQHDEYHLFLSWRRLLLVVFGLVILYWVAYQIVAPRFIVEGQGRQVS